LDSLIAAAYDSYLTWFEKPIPALVKAWVQTPASDPLKAKTSEQIALLRAWDLRWSATSVPTSLAVFWGEDIQRRVRRNGLSAVNYIAGEATAEQLLQSLSAASDKLAADFGTWKTPWGRHQPLPASDRRHRSPVHRRRPQHSGWLYVRDLGIVGLIRRAPVQGFEEDLRDQRQQLRGRRRVRQYRASQSRDRRRSERRFVVVPLQ